MSPAFVARPDCEQLRTVCTTVRYDEYVQFLELASERHVKVAGMQDSLHVYTPASFGSSGLGQSITFRSSAGAQTAEMYQCVESSHEEKCGKDEKCRAYSYKMEWLRHPVDSNSFSMTGQAQQARQSGCPGFQGNPPWPHDVLPTVETSWVNT
eukprot:s4110_g9.t3